MGGSSGDQVTQGGSSQERGGHQSSRDTECGAWLQGSGLLCPAASGKIQAFLFCSDSFCISCRVAVLGRNPSPHEARALQTPGHGQPCFLLGLLGRPASVGGSRRRADSWGWDFGHHVARGTLVRPPSALPARFWVSMTCSAPRLPRGPRCPRCSSLASSLGVFVARVLLAGAWILGTPGCRAGCSVPVLLLSCWEQVTSRSCRQQQSSAPVLTVGDADPWWSDPGQPFSLPIVWSRVVAWPGACRPALVLV